MSKALERTLPPAVAYDEDVVAWADAQAARLRAIADPRLDTDHIADELESMGRSDRNELDSRLTVLVQHLLKWQFQPARRSNSWRRTIVEQRTRIARILRDSPSLRRYAKEAVSHQYDLARTYAADEMRPDPSALAGTCPYALDQLLDPAFLPGPPAADDLPVE